MAAKPHIKGKGKMENPTIKGKNKTGQPKEKQWKSKQSSTATRTQGSGETQTENVAIILHNEMLPPLSSTIHPPVNEKDAPQIEATANNDALIENSVLPLSVDLHGDHQPKHRESSTHTDRPCPTIDELRSFDESVQQRIVQQSCPEPVPSYGLYVLSEKLKQLKSCLRSWNRDTFGNIFDNIHRAESKVEEQEIKFQSDQSEGQRKNLHEAQAELLWHLKNEEVFLQQKN
ncbi:hypothetical protein ACH5RR_015849 [Cinchona calisaya]|uniref:Uncharacterized protein n=1 Tax=Cinchona calisaya TaxID=153742 RepID=A0ABD2ZXE2_9GENT